MTDTTTYFDKAREKENIKLWHDDVRPAPEGWFWVKNNDEARAFLISGKVTELSMDHDLGADLLDYDFDSMTLEEISHLRGTAEETGLDLAKWIAASGDTEGGRIDSIEIITVHSWNPYGAQQMADVLRDAGYTVLIAPYQL